MVKMSTLRKATTTADITRVYVLMGVADIHKTPAHKQGRI